MLPDTHYEHAKADALRRRLPALVPLLEALSRAAAVLRAADWNVRAEEDTDSMSRPHGA